MPDWIRSLLAVIAGFVAGSIVNMGIVMLGPSLIPPPAGVDVSDPESLRQGIHLFEARHFIMPFLAHALGTLAGALVAYRVAAGHKARMAYVIGALFLIGGIVAASMIPAPAWFVALDLIVAYLPMAWLATRIGARAGQGEPASRMSEA